jgi:peroxiredoxin
MKVSSVFITFCCYVFSCSVAHSEQASEFKLLNIQGEQVQLSDYRGQVVLVDFWASWCPPCVRSFPWMNKMHKKYSAKGLQILAINIDKRKQDVNLFLKQNPANFTVLLDPKSKLMRQYKVESMPTSFLIDKKGNIIKKHRGFREDNIIYFEKDIRTALSIF